MAIIKSTLSRTAVDYRYAYMILATHVSAMYALAWYLNISPYYRTGMFYLSLATMGMLIFAFSYMLWMVIRFLFEKRERPTLALFQHIKTVMIRDDRYAHAFHSLAIFILMITAFATIKSSIPVINPFSWDKTFIQVDRLIFGGLDPFIWTSKIFGNAYAVIILNFFYNLWMIVVVAAMVFIAWTRNHNLRLRFMFAALLGWLLAGNILAILFSSAGPCFVSFLSGDRTYGPLMKLLSDIHTDTGMVHALTAQEMLWTAYAREAGAISGISAMPSLHVLFAALIAFATLDMRLPFRLAGIAFAILIAIGSVQLAWHYAVDGIAGVVLAAIFWKASGFLTDRSLAKAVREMDAKASA